MDLEKAYIYIHIHSYIHISHAAGNHVPSPLEKTEKKANMQTEAELAKKQKRDQWPHATLDTLDPETRPIHPSYTP